MKCYVNIIKDQPIGFLPDSPIAMENMSVPVDVLFNENDTCGEVVPLVDALVPFMSADGVAGAYEFTKGENVVLGHGDISFEPVASK